RDPQLCGLMDRIACVDDDSKRNPGYFPGFLTVTLKDGRCFVRDQRHEMGTAQNPLDPAAVEKKFRDNLEPFYSAGQIRRIEETVRRFDALPRAGELLDALRR
ncbi:MAG: MmgE/PrpD family protein, partial [Dysosmobacter sp.]|nr:MmgE/PrpD family protein [Dysosmobacter sp.]